MPYEPSPFEDATDLVIVSQSGPEPEFDAVTRDLLLNNYEELLQQFQAQSVQGEPGQEEPGQWLESPLLKVASLGQNVPWLFRLTFRTRGMAEAANGELLEWDRFVIALRFLPDYLTRADRFEMMRLVEPQDPRPFHPNISTDGAICVEVYPGESLLEICRSLHELLRWRLRQYDERDALNPRACSWGRAHIDCPLDDRPLFGRRLEIQWEDV